jgi:hypothetical protein
MPVAVGGADVAGISAAYRRRQAVWWVRLSALDWRRQGRGRRRFLRLAAFCILYLVEECSWWLCACRRSGWCSWSVGVADVGGRGGGRGPGWLCGISWRPAVGAAGVAGAAIPLVGASVPSAGMGATAAVVDVRVLSFAPLGA